MPAAPDSLGAIVAQALGTLTRAREGQHAQLRSREVGVVRTVSTGVAKISGLPGVGLDECVEFASGLPGIAFNLSEDAIGVVLLGESSDLEAGTEVTRTGRVIDVPVGERLLGRAINPLGQPLDGAGPINSTTRLPIERPAPHIINRAPGHNAAANRVNSSTRSSRLVAASGS